VDVLCQARASEKCPELDRERGLYPGIIRLAEMCVALLFEPGRIMKRLAAEPAPAAMANEAKAAA
jgi:hypothetical protein